MTINEKIKEFRKEYKSTIIKTVTYNHEGSIPVGSAEEIGRMYYQEIEDWLRSTFLSQQQSFKEALGEMEENIPMPYSMTIHKCEDDPYIRARNDLRQEVLTKIGGE
jgi:2-hydroxy-3-keto-5-methylthiopentenyl-1-phosphate phosphatase